jgi:hypothetical protein
MNNEDNKSNILLKTEEAIAVFNKAIADIKLISEQNEGNKLIAPEAALKSMWHLCNIAYNHSHQLRFNSLTNDCYERGEEYKHTLNKFVTTYLELFFPECFLSPASLGLVNEKSTWRNNNGDLWYNRPRVDKFTPQAVGLFQSYRRFVVTSTGFIYGDCANEYSMLLRSVYETIVRMDRDIIRASKVLAVSQKPKNSNKGIGYIDQRWVDAIVGDRPWRYLGQAIQIPADIFRHIYPLVPPFSSVIQQTEEFQLYKTTFQICAYDAIDWVEERENALKKTGTSNTPSYGVVGESILAKSCIFEI